MYMYHFAPRLRYTSNKIVGVVVGGLGWSTGMVADTYSTGMVADTYSTGMVADTYSTGMVADTYSNGH